MDTQTRENLLAALREEAYTYARYKLMAVAARDESDADAAALFEGIATVSLHEHIATLAGLAGIIGADADNLAAAIQDESYQAADTYRAFAEQARSGGETAIADQFEAIRVDKLAHVHALESTLERLEAPA
jgi:rubrerythrin